MQNGSHDGRIAEGYLYNIYIDSSIIYQSKASEASSKIRKLFKMDFISFSVPVIHYLNGHKDMIALLGVSILLVIRLITLLPRFIKTFSSAFF